MWKTISSQDKKMKNHLLGDFKVMQKVFLITSMSLLVSLFVVGCASEYTIEDYQKDIENLGNDNSESAWDEVKEASDDEIDKIEEVDKIIDSLKEYKKKVDAVDEKIDDAKLKEVHAFCMKSIALKIDAFTKIREGLSNDDDEAVAAGEEILSESLMHSFGWAGAILKLMGSSNLNNQ